MKHYTFVWREILLIMAIAILRTSQRAEKLAKLGIQYLDCSTGGVYARRGYCLMVGGADHAVSAAVLSSMPSHQVSMPLLGPMTEILFSITRTWWLHQTSWRWSLCEDGHNGIEYGTCKHMPKVSISYEANAGSKYVGKVIQSRPYGLSRRLLRY